MFIKVNNSQSFIVIIIQIPKRVPHFCNRGQKLADTVNYIDILVRIKGL